MKWNLEFEVIYAEPPEKVWRALRRRSSAQRLPGEVFIGLKLLLSQSTELQCMALEECQILQVPYDIGTDRRPESRQVSKRAAQGVLP
jgi:hypothetical protein